jgi:hypothetical protein
MKNPNVSLGIANHYYVIIVFPIVLFIWNLVSLITMNKITRIFVYILLGIIILIYWFNTINNYPYRTLFVLLVSAGILSTGLYFFHKLIIKEK